MVCKRKTTLKPHNITITLSQSFLLYLHYIMV